MDFALNNRQSLRWHSVDPGNITHFQVLANACGVVGCLGTDMVGYQISDLGWRLLDGEYLLARCILVFFFFPQHSFGSTKQIFHFQKTSIFQKIRTGESLGAIHLMQRHMLICHQLASSLFCHFKTWEDSKPVFVFGVSLEVDSHSYCNFFDMASWHSAFD